jgi:hypothetical protein
MVVRDFTTSKSSRKGAVPVLIVIHTTEGVMRLKDRAAFWDGVEASAHTGVGSPQFDEGSKSARYVRDDDKAWTCAFYNPVSLNIEIEGFAAQRSWNDNVVDEVARQVAHWSIHHNIPIQFGAVFGGAVIRRGVLGHRRLGALGGGHSDPGTFPMRKMLRRAKQIKKLRLLEEAK